MKKPRPHQVRAITLLKDAARRGRRRPILKAPTGAGKTFVAALVVRSALEKSKRVLFIVDAISLIDQTVEAFYAEGIYDIGVIQGDHPMQDWSKPVQVASVQTLRRRGMPKDIDLVIVDEAHGQDKWLVDIMASPAWANIIFIGLSATPWSKGLGNVYDELLTPVSMQELIDDGYLSSFRVFAASHPDLGEVKTSKGDYDTGQLAGVMSDGALIADIVTTWLKLGENRPTVAFCVDRAHAKKVQRRFDEAGIGCGYIDAFTDRLDRAAIRGQLDRGEIKVVANVGCLTKGVDWAIGCVILARPTKSEILFVQMVGRGLRVNEGIPDCIILDHADNTLRMGFVTDIGRDELCTAKKGDRAPAMKPAALPKECPSCTYLKPPKVRECPGCGFVPERVSKIDEADGELVQVTRGKLQATMAEKQAWHAQLNTIAHGRSYSSGWVSNTYKKRFGVWPNQLNRFATAEPTQEVRDFVTSQLIRFAKGRRAA